MRTNRHAWFWAVLTFFLLACAEVPPNNPFDPETPIDRQARASVVGRAVLPAGFDPVLFGSSTVELDGQGRTVTQGVSGDGRFAFDDVAPGVYALNLSVPGLRASQRVVNVDIGARTDIGDVALRVDFGSTNQGAVIGRARRVGAADDGHGDIRVEAVDTPYATQTASDGQFRLELPAASYSLRFAAAGYASPGNIEVRVGPGEAVNLPDPVLLVGEPATVRGVVRLYTEAAGAELAGAAALLPSVEVRLTVLGEAEPSQIQRPGADGLFIMPDVNPGTYEVSATLSGFATATALVEARPGESASAALALAQARGVLTGRVARADRAGTGEATVVLTGKASEPAVAGQRLAARTTPGDDGFVLEGVPTGTWEVTATAEGYRTPAAVDVRVEPGVDARFEATLAPRVARMRAPEFSTGTVELTFDRDDELTHAQVWVDAEAPPPDAAFALLGGPRGDTLSLDIADEGPHTVYARLANRTAAEPGSGDALFASSVPMCETSRMFSRNHRSIFVSPNTSSTLKPARKAWRK